jgi:hypothetical protein
VQAQYPAPEAHAPAVAPPVFAPLPEQAARLGLSDHLVLPLPPDLELLPTVHLRSSAGRFYHLLQWYDRSRISKQHFCRICGYFCSF